MYHPQFDPTCELELIHWITYYLTLHIYYAIFLHNSFQLEYFNYFNYLFSELYFSYK